MDAQTLFEALRDVRYNLPNEKGWRLLREILEIEYEQRENDDDPNHMYRDMKRKVRLYNEIKAYE